MTTITHLAARALRKRHTLRYKVSELHYSYDFPPQYTRSQVLRAIRTAHHITHIIDAATNQELTTYVARLERITADFDALSETDKRYTLLQLSARLTPKTTLN